MTTHPRASAIYAFANSTWVRVVLVLISVALFLIACLSPALVFTGVNGQEVMPGFWILAIGWLGPSFGQFAWFANPVLFLSMLALLFRKRVAAFVLALVSLAIAANTWLLFSQPIPADEGGVNQLTLQHLHFGFYFWIASMLVVGFAALLLRLMDRRWRTRAHNA